MAEKGNPGSQAEPGIDRPATVLIADDDEALARLIEKNLGRAGFRTASASSGAEAIARIADRPPTLLLLDYRLPDMTGQEVIEALLEQDCRLPFIVTTGYGDEQIAVEMMKLGARDYLAKSTGFLNLLLPVVKRVVEQLAAEERLVTAEAALYDSEQKLRLIAENASDAIFGYDMDRRLIYVNPAFEELTGYSVDELWERNFINWVHPDDEARMMAQWDAMFEGKSFPDEEFRLVTKTGQEKWCLSSWGPIYDGAGRQIGVQGRERDITRRKNAEKKQAHFQNLLKAISDVNQLIVRERDPRVMLRQACERLLSTRGYDAMWIGLLDEAGQTVRAVASAGVDPAGEPIAFSLQNAEGSFHCARTALGERRPFLVKDVDDSEPCTACAFRARQPHQGALAVPLLHREQQYGVLVVYTARPWAFDGDEVELLSELAGDLALGLCFAEEEQKRETAEAALRVSEERFRRLSGLSFEGIAIHDQGKIFDANQAMAAMFGYELSEFIGKNALDFAAPESRDVVLENIRSGYEKPYEAVGLRKDGTTFPVEIIGRAIPFEGRTIRVTAIRDITERVRAEGEIRRRNRELALLNRVIAASANDLEPEAVLEVACRELARAFDMTLVRAALLNREKTAAVVVARYPATVPEGGPEHPLPWRDVIPVADSPPLQYLLTHKAPLAVDDVQTDPLLTPIRNLLLQRGTTSLLILPLTIEGEVVGGMSLNTTEPRHFTAKEVNLAWSVADQVAGVLARARLDQERRRLTTAIEQGAESVIITDANGTILYVNPAFERISGYNRAEVIGQNLRLLRGDQQDSALYRELWETISSGQVWRGRFINQRKDGSLYTEEATVSPVRDESGAIVNYVSVQRDVTRELELEEQYRQAQKMESIGLLAGGIAHDFNNLLTAINGFAKLLKYELAADDPGQEMVDKILRSGQRAADLVRQLLAFSRKQIIDPRVLNLNTIVAEMDKMLRRIIGEDIELETRLGPDLWQVKIDPAQMGQVIVNLAVNAGDAMPEGGKLTIETANTVLDETYTAQHLELQPGDYVRLAISDAGTGMSEAVRARIFEPFFTTKEMGQGTGLGLATVFGIVKQSQGHIEVASEPGRGTTFNIYLPRALEELPPRGNPEARGQEPMSPGTETILVVEDEAMVRELACRVLRGQGYTVLEAANGQAALRLLQEHSGQVHLLLTDVVMPQMGGKALADELATARPNTKVIFISGYTDRGFARHGVLEAGIEFIQKPFSPGTLTRKVRQVLDKE
ncbi:MAG: PAS domain S-box protein [Anaerolineae bacterium]